MQNSPLLCVVPPSYQLSQSAAIALGWHVGTLPQRVTKQGDSAGFAATGNRWGAPVHPQHPYGSPVSAHFVDSAGTESKALCL